MKAEDGKRKRSGSAGLSLADRTLVKEYCVTLGRTNSAVRKLMRDVVVGRVATTAPINPATGYPRGWSERNLLRHAPKRTEMVFKKFELCLGKMGGAK